MATNRNDSFEVDNGVVIDDSVLLLNDGGDAVLKDESHPVELKINDFIMRKIKSDYDLTIPENYQHVTFFCFTVEHSLTVDGQLVLTF